MQKVENFPGIAHHDMDRLAFHANQMAAILGRSNLDTGDELTEFIIARLVRYALEETNANSSPSRSFKNISEPSIIQPLSPNDSLPDHETN